MKKTLLKGALLTFVTLFSAAFIFCSLSFAAPVSGEIFEFKQPDGSNVSVKL